MSYDDYITGGIVGTVFGFGTGHAVQGRYQEKGWVFTAGEVAASGLVIASLAPCRDDFFSQRNITIQNRLAKCQKVGLVVGDLSFLGLRLWETLDAWTAPNPRLKKHFFGDLPKESSGSLALSVMPGVGREPSMLNLSLSF